MYVGKFMMYKINTYNLFTKLNNYRHLWRFLVTKFFYYYYIIIIRNQITYWWDFYIKRSIF